VPVYSIITPVYNGEAYIEETVQSVLTAVELSGISCEYIVVDDGSTDETSRILARFNGRISYINKENEGQAKAINKGLNSARGTYSIIVNADDPILGPELLVESLHILDSDLSLVGTYPDWQIINSEGLITEIVQAKDFSISEMVGNFNCLIGPGGVFRTDAAQKIGGWNPEYRFVPDYDFWLRLLDFGTFHHIPKVLATWRMHVNSISISSRNKYMANERIGVIQSYLARNPKIDPTIQKSARANSIYRAAILSFFDSQIDGKQLFFQALRCHPTLILRKDLRVNCFLIMLPFSRILTNLVRDFALIQRLSLRLQRKLKG
jgi:glycosyltransferase involved in cell wall biosynthesis